MCSRPSPSPGPGPGPSPIALALALALALQDRPYTAGQATPQRTPQRPPSTGDRDDSRSPQEAWPRGASVGVDVAEVADIEGVARLLGSLSHPSVIVMVR